MLLNESFWFDVTSLACNAGVTRRYEAWHPGAAEIRALTQELLAMVPPTRAVDLPPHNGLKVAESARAQNYSMLKKKRVILSHY